MNTTRAAKKPHHKNPPLLTITEACQQLRISPSTLYRMWEDGCGPRRIELPKSGAKRIRQDHLDDFIASLEVAA